MPSDSSVPLTPPLQKPERLGSLDAYRGVVMFLMMAEVLELRRVAAALPESSLWQFLAWHQTHVPWTGCTLHDLIQPSFSFLVGVSLPFSLASRLARGHTRGRLLAHAVLRAAVLVLLGVFLRSMSKTQTHWTFEDTLSQIGLGYVPLFLLGFARPRWQWVALALILVGCWGAFLAFPLPATGFSYAAVGVPPDWPHHDSGLAAHWNKNSNLAWAFDRWFLNQFPRPEPFAYHPGGYATLSFVPTLGTMILGLLAGGWLRRDWSAWQKEIRMVAAGALALLAGLLLHQLGLCPIVKRIWTPSWVLYSGGWCLLLLAAFYAVIDVRGWKAWSFPWRVMGANSIAAYLLAHGPDEFIRRSLIIHLGEPFFQQWGLAYSSFILGAVILAIEWLILWWLYRKQIYIRI